MAEVGVAGIVAAARRPTMVAGVEAVRTAAVAAAVADMLRPAAATADTDKSKQAPSK